MRALAAATLVASCTLDGCPREPSATDLPAVPESALQLTHGVAAGDLAHGSVSLWARASRLAVLNFELISSGSPAQRQSCEVDADSDFAASVRFNGLSPDAEYQYRAWLTEAGARGRSVESSSSWGRFRTPPVADAASALRLAWGADLAGQNVCRHPVLGFPIFEGLAAREPDVFLSLGDMIYADGLCTERDPWGGAQIPGVFPLATELLHFRARWRYAREDPGFRAFLARTSWIATWDDHEVLNDFGPTDDNRSTAPYRLDLHLMPVGERAMRENVPIGPEPQTFQRRLRWGRHAELFVLDVRRFRDSNQAVDDPEHPKSMLGAEQRRWLIEGLVSSSATWKLVASSVPLSIPTGYGQYRDGWADFDSDTGFEQELAAMVRELHAREVRNLVFLTADVHLASVSRYRPFASDPEYVFYEATSGPLNAWVFPETNLDLELWPERLFYFAPEHAATSYEQAKAYFNFGLIEISTSGELSLSIQGTRGEPVYELSLSPLRSSPRG